MRMTSRLLDMAREVESQMVREIGSQVVCEVVKEVCV